MPRKLFDVVEDGELVDEIYQEEDGTFFHNIYYKEMGPAPDDGDE